MPLFYGKKDLNLMNNLNRQLIQKIIDTKVKFLKLDVRQITQNIYGQAKTKFYMQPIQLPALIQHENPNITDQLYGVNYQHFLVVKLNIQMLKQINLYPEVGDVVQYNQSDFEVASIVNNQFIGGHVQNKFSLVLNCVHTAVSKTQTSGNTKALIQQRRPSIYKD